MVPPSEASPMIDDNIFKARQQYGAGRVYDAA
jgi:hypothetical protein